MAAAVPHQEGKYVLAAAEIGSDIDAVVYFVMIEVAVLVAGDEFAVYVEYVVVAGRNKAFRLAAVIVESVEKFGVFVLAEFLRIPYPKSFL